MGSPVKYFCWEFFLSIAVQLGQALAYLHQSQIIHKDIKPANIIINPQTGIVKFIDFSIASRLSKETPQLSNPNQLEGTLAYMSPEQTGRMNRTLDYRSDFYSLGVTFYEILTGRLPFISNDPLELLHCHLAKQPVAISELNPEIPSSVEAIVTKLMAKNAEDRYQSANGLLADLEICLDQLKTKGEITDFIPGRLDTISQLLIPQKLYGREKQVNELLAAFDRVTTDSSELVLVSGYSGIGKSAVVNEVNKPITKAKGYFISGKFDQLKRNIPYIALIQAFGSLMQQLLTENPEQLDKWRSKILAALGSNGRVIIDVIPEVELIIGEQPEVLQLGPIESQNRFHRVFTEFIHVFTQKEHPLVLFLDDLQWADSATLKLMQLLLSDPDSKHLLLIGAYRDNEVETRSGTSCRFANASLHPLIQTVEEINKVGTVINNIVLQPIDLANVTQLVADTLQESRFLQFPNERVIPLAELIFNKTGGNPFFLTQLLQALYQENLLYFDFKQSLWVWNLVEIQAISITDKSVVELVASRIEKLPDSTQGILKLAACIGDKFTLDVLSVVNEESPSATASELYSALQAGLILPLSETYRIPLVFHLEVAVNLTFDPKRVGYKFLHDRVQQAAYSLIAESDQKTTHLKIGELLLQNTPPQELESNIFDIVNQLNLGIDTLTQELKKEELARLNLIAGRKAKAFAAYESAFKYLNTGVKLLNVGAWQTNYDLTLGLYEGSTETAYLSGDFERMQQLAEVVLELAKNILDKVKVYEVKILSCVAQKKYQEAIDIGLSVLKLLDIKFPANPNNLNVLLGLFRTKLTLGGKRPEDLMKLPKMTNPYAIAAINLIDAISYPAYVTSPKLMLLLILSAVNLSITYGNSPLSSFFYSAYGLVLSSIINNIEYGYEFGKLALNLLPQFNEKKANSKTLCNTAYSILVWKSHLRESVPLFQLGQESGLLTGDLVYAATTYNLECMFLLVIGQKLADLEQKITAHSHVINQLKQEVHLNYLELLRQVVLNLMGNSSDPCRLIGAAYNEEQLLPDYQQANDLTSLCSLYSYKLTLCYLFGKYSQALENADKAASYSSGLLGSVVIPLLYFYDSLTRLAMYISGDKTEQKRFLHKVKANQKKMKHWAKHAPMNFQHKYDLVEAERYRVLGNNYQAADYYDRAIQGAKENAYIQEEALANERAAEFYLALGKEKIAKTYMNEAYYGYIRWGAIAKVQDLDERYANWIIRSEITTQTKDIPTTILTKNSSIKNIDLATVMKATEAIQTEIILDNLLGKLLNIILENAGAKKGCLIL